MRLRKSLVGLLAGVVMAGIIAAPIPASAQNWRDLIHRRQQTKNTWRDIAIGAGALGVYGLLKHDSTLTFAGIAGALYSANRYEQDRRSESRMDRARASMFSRGSFYRNGHRYTRHTVYRNGQKYYQFRRDD